MTAEKILLVAFYLLSPLLIMHLCDRFSVLRKIGAVIIAYFVGILFGSAEIFEAESISATQDAVINISVSIAIPLLLFSSDLKKTVLLARKTIISLFIAVAVVAVVVFAGYFIFRLPDHHEFSKVGGLLVGVYTGGTPNLAALQMILGIKPEIYLAVHTYDMLISTIYLFFLMAFGQRLFSLILPKYKPLSASISETGNVAEEIEPMSGLFKRRRLLPLLKAFLLAVVIFAAGAGLMIVTSAKYQMAVFILTITTLSIAASFNKKVRETERTYDLGIYFILVFSIVVASKVNPEALSAVNSTVFLYVTFVVIAGLILHVLISAIFRIDTDTTIITSTALICSPPFVPVIAGALRNKEIIIPGMTVGIVGYTIGNYLGYLMTLLLMSFDYL